MYRKEFKDYNDKQSYIKQLKQENNIDYGFIVNNKTLIKCNGYNELRSGLTLTNTIGQKVTLVIQ
jgi:hypothetical protein